MKTTYPASGAFQSFYANRQNCEERLKMAASIKKKKESKLKKAVAISALVGAVAPVIASNLAKGRGRVMVDTFKNSNAGFVKKFNSVRNLFEIESFKEMLASTVGAIGLGMSVGIMKDKNPENREAKLKEGTFEFLNNITPDCLVLMGNLIADKTGFAAKGLAKGVRIAASVALGMFMANKASNKINKHIFDKDKKDYDKRNFKISDCFVHADDIIGIFVLDRNPIARAIQLDKLLPLLYAKSAYEAGVATKPDKKSVNNADKN